MEINKKKISNVLWKVNILLIFLITIYSISLTSAFPIVVRPLSSGSIQPSQNIFYTFNFSTDNLCLNVLSSHSVNITTDKYGVGYTNLDISSLSSTPSYLCEYRNGILRKTHSIPDMIFRDIYARNITTSVLLVGSNKTDVENELVDLRNEIGGFEIPSTNITSDWQDSVLSISTYTPPVSPFKGDRYIIPQFASGDWYGGAGDWNYRQEVNLSSTYVSSTQTNFPVSIIIEDSNDLFTYAQDDGDDIVFTSDDKITKIPYELVYYNNSVGYQYAEIYVKVPSISSSSTTSIYMYYGNPSASAQSDKTNVWDNNFEAIFHMESFNSTAITGSTSNNEIGSLEDSPDEVRGILYNAQQFNGGTDGAWVNTSVDTKLSSGSFTVTAWVKGVQSGSDYLVAQAHSFSPYASDFILGYLNNGIWMRGKTVSGLNILSDGNWHQTSIVFDGTNAKLIIDGNLIGSVTPTGYDALGTVKLMTRGDAISTSRYSGVMDEVRISTTDRSTDWIDLTYQNIKNMDYFVSFGNQRISGAVTTDWTGHINEITEWDGSAWTFEIPTIGWASIVNDEGVPYWFDGSNWDYLTSSISHRSLRNLYGIDSNNDGWHLTSSQWVSATRDATNSLNGLMPSGKLNLWDSAWHIGTDITQDLFINKANPSLVFEDDDQTAHQIKQDNKSLTIYGGNVSEDSFDKLNNSANVVIDGNITSDYFVGDGSQLTGLSGDNSSWNESYADTLYAGSEWAYNQTYSGSTYNSTYDEWAYNQTTPANDYTDGVVSDNNGSWTSTYNATYDTWSYNQTYSGSTYNSTYDTWSYNQTIPAMDYLDSNPYSWLNESGFDDTYLRLNQTDSPQNVITNVGVGYNISNYDFFGGGNLILPKLNFFNDNAIGFDKRLGMLDFGLIIQDIEDTSPILLFAGSSISQPLGQILYNLPTEELRFVPSLHTSDSNYPYLILKERIFEGVEYPSLTGLSNTSSEGIIIEPSLNLYNPSGSPLLTFTNGISNSTNVMSLTDDGLMSMGGVSATVDEENSDTGFKEVLTLSGKYLSQSGAGNETAIVFKDGAYEGLGAKRKTGAITSYLESVGEGWTAGLKFYTFNNATYETPQERLYIKGDGNVRIGGSGNPSYPLVVNNSVSDISIWAKGNISATGYITRTSVYEEEDGKTTFDFIKESSYYLDENGSIQHNKFYGYTESKLTEYPFTKTETQEVCETVDYGNKLTLEKDKKVSCKEVEVEVTDYDRPVETISEGVDLGKEIDVLRQGLYELNEEILVIKQENELLKSELCKKDNTYPWCNIGIIK